MWGNFLNTHFDFIIFAESSKNGRGGEFVNPLTLKPLPGDLIEIKRAGVKEIQTQWVMSSRNPELIVQVSPTVTTSIESGGHPPSIELKKLNEVANGAQVRIHKLGQVSDTDTNTKDNEKRSEFDPVLNCLIWLFSLYIGYAILCLLQELFGNFVGFLIFFIMFL